MCEISRSISSLEDTLYDVKSDIRDIEMEVNVDTDDFEVSVTSYISSLLLSSIFLLVST